MLNRIFIQNIALIDKLDVEFEPGFNVLTGETGAGKSIIIDSVNLVLGERADRELIGSHAQKALVEAVFSVDDSAVAEALDELLPEAFALVREASVRTTGMRHFDVQLIGGVVLHQGRIAEMKTGEGKTLVATLPAYLNLRARAYIS